MKTTEDLIEIAARAAAVTDSGPEGSQLFDIHWAEFEETYKAGARAMFGAIRVPLAENLSDVLQSRQFQQQFNGCRIDSAWVWAEILKGMLGDCKGLTK